MMAVATARSTMASIDKDDLTKALVISTALSALQESFSLAAACQALVLMCTSENIHPIRRRRRRPLVMSKINLKEALTAVGD